MTSRWAGLPVIVILGGLSGVLLVTRGWSWITVYFIAATAASVLFETVRFMIHRGDSRGPSGGG